MYRMNSIRERFLLKIVDMSIGEKIVYEHPSYRIVVQKQKQEVKIKKGKTPDIIIIDDLISKDYK